MKFLKSLVIIVLVTISCNSITAQQTLVQTTPPTLGNNVIPGPISVQGINIGTGSGSYSTAVGQGALNAATTSSSANIALGFEALYQNTNGIDNTATGMEALKSNAGGGQNGAYGYLSLASNIDGGNNNAFGNFTLQYNDHGNYNSAFGASALLKNVGINSSSNSAFGASALENNLTGYENSAFGSAALVANESGYNNSAFGGGALADNQTGNYNTAIGYQALSLTTGSYNVGIGNLAQVPTASGSSQLSIQNVIYGINMTGANGNIGIGLVPTPYSGTNISKLNIAGNTTYSPSLQLQGVPTSSSAVTNYLYVDPVTKVVGQAPLPSASGTVTSFSSNSSGVSTLFTTSVSNPTTTPLLTFTLANAGGNTWFGNNTGTSAAPTYNSAGSLTSATPSVLSITGTNTLLNNTTITVNQANATQPGFLSAADWNTFNNKWSLTGNASTAPGTGAGQNFLGTTDNNDLVIATNNTEAMRITAAGNIGIGTTSPSATLDVNGSLKFESLAPNPYPVNTPGVTALVIDASGNVYKGIQDAYRPATTTSSPDSLTTEVNDLKNQVNNLRSLVELMMANGGVSSSNKVFSVYPNPATNQIQIQPNLNPINSSSQDVEIRDLSNNIVVGKTPFQGSTSVSLSNTLSSGTYLVVIYENNKIVQTERIEIIR